MLTLAALVDRAATARRPVEAGSRSAGRRHRHHGQQGHQHRSHRRLPSSPGVCPRVPKCARPPVGRQPFRPSDLGFCTFPTCCDPRKHPLKVAARVRIPYGLQRKAPGQDPSGQGLSPFPAAVACAPCARPATVHISAAWSSSECSPGSYPGGRRFKSGRCHGGPAQVAQPERVDRAGGRRCGYA